MTCRVTELKGGWISSCWLSKEGHKIIQGRRNSSHAFLRLSFYIALGNFHHCFRKTFSMGKALQLYTDWYIVGFVIFWRLLSEHEVIKNIFCRGERTKLKLKLILKYLSDLWKVWIDNGGICTFNYFHNWETILEEFFFVS